MKRFVNWFKRVIRFAVAIFASREFAFIYCLVGTVAQVTHTYFLTSSISSFTGNFKIAQAILISFFISSSLLYFVAIAEDKRLDNGKRTKESKRIFLAVNIFMIIEILINFYYYTRHLVIDSEQVQVFDFIFAVLVSCLLPVTIKLYANSIRAKEWLVEFDEQEKDFKLEESNEHIIRLEQIENYIDEQRNSAFDFKGHVDKLFSNWLKDNNLDVALPENLSQQLQDIVKTYVDDGSMFTPEVLSKILNEIKDGIDTDIYDIFSKNQKLFLQQFENKCQSYINQLPKHYKTAKMEDVELKPIEEIQNEQ